MTDNEKRGVMAGNAPASVPIVDAQSSDWEDVEITRKDQPDVRFRGKLLGAVDSREEDRGGDRNRGRWTRLELWELESGNWVATAIGCSDKEGEIDIGKVLLIYKTPIMPVMSEPWTEEKIALDRMFQAMAFWGHSWLAKALAEKLGWEPYEILI